MIHLFCGYDRREAVGFHVFMASVLKHATVPVCFHRLDRMGLPEGSNAFTFSRFLVPYLMGFEGVAIFADASDMLMMGDIAELAACYDGRSAVQVVQHNYKTRNPRKYIGTDMECPNRDYARKNWASLMLINCAHAAWLGIGPADVERGAQRPAELLGLRWMLDEVIGALPPEWNVLTDEGQPLDGARLLHWTAGLPAFRHYVNAPGAEHWHRQRMEMNGVDA